METFNAEEVKEKSIVRKKYVVSTITSETIVHGSRNKDRNPELSFYCYVIKISVGKLMILTNMT